MKLGKSYSPRKPISSDSEIVGNHWRVWAEQGRYYYEYDAGHFVDKFRKIEISEEDFLLVKTRQLEGQELWRKYLS